MAQFDLPLAELERYRPRLAVPNDLDEFWEETLAETRAHDLDVVVAEVENHLSLVTTYDVTFSGYGGDRIRAWLTVPRGTDAALPGVVEFLGYSAGRGLAHQRIEWALAGYAHFTMDTRGHGWGGSTGVTPDPSPEAGLNAVPGHMTRGILDPRSYFYRRVFADAIRAVEAAASSPLIDADRIALAGTSQGGGIAIAVAALSGHPLRGALVDVPFLCHFERAVTMTDDDPYNEVARYLKRHRDSVQQAFRTLSYFDGAVLAERASIPALFSVGLMDTTCPPSTVYAAYNRWGGDSKEIKVYPFNQHEGGAEFHQVAKYEWLRRLFG